MSEDRKKRRASEKATAQEATRLRNAIRKSWLSAPVDLHDSLEKHLNGTAGLIEGLVSCARAGHPPPKAVRAFAISLATAIDYGLTAVFTNITETEISAVLTEMVSNLEDRLQKRAVAAATKQDNKPETNKPEAPPIPARSSSIIAPNAMEINAVERSKTRDRT